MLCSCCGFPISGESHAVENGQRQVCEQCWNNPEMFFPEKIKEDRRLTLLSNMAKEKTNRNGTVEVQAIKLVQKGIEMYVGKMKVNDILSLYELDKFKDEELEGYQRERYEERTSELVGYLEKSPLAVMPAILVGLRKTNFIPADGDLGILRIERKKGALWIIDGQHRVGGFSKVRDRFYFSKSLGVSLFSDLMDYEFPVVFVDSSGAAEKVKQKGAKQPLNELTAEDIEKTIFFVVNKTQRGISPSLKDALLYTIKTSGIEGLSIVDREGWRIIGAQIGITLNCRESSPLRARINVSGKRNSGKPVQLNSFVSSLEVLFKDKDFSDLSIEDKVSFLEAFWSKMKELVPEAFGIPEGKSEEEFGKRFSSNIGLRNAESEQAKETKFEDRYLLLTALSIYSLHRVARDLLHSVIKTGVDFKQSESFDSSLKPIKSFDWKAKTSPLSALGGMNGVNKAYDLLSEVIGQEKWSTVQTMHDRQLGTYANVKH